MVAPKTCHCCSTSCDNISPGLAWPPRQTTICPLGPSAVSPIASAVKRFRHEFDHYVQFGYPIAGVEHHARIRSPHWSVQLMSDTAADTDAAPQPPPKTTLSITVDGKAHEANPGQLVIDACEDAGVYVPRFAITRVWPRLACAASASWKSKAHAGRCRSCRA